MKKIALLLITVSMFWSCEKNDPEIQNEEELITTLSYTLTAPDNSKIVLSFKDLDGDGGNAPVITSGVLKANTAYTGVLTLLNESVSPADDITKEVLEEADEHQLFFTLTQANMTVTYDDTDKNGNPLGLKTKVTTRAASSGKLKITLKHEPNKTAMGVKDGNIANAGGETDIEVEFNVQIQ